jgi:pSer/pThr/pTyr-binding forkhead associated (FHA) protein
MLTLERDDSTLLPGMFRLAVTAPDDQQPTIQVVEATHALIGRAAGCTVRFDHPKVGRRHAYLQAIYGRIYCIDLGSGGGTYWGELARKGGWFDPSDVVRIGPYQIQLVDTLGLGSGLESFGDDFDPLDRYVDAHGRLPKVTLTVRGAGRRANYTISRPITLVGSAAPCKLRLGDKTVSSIHCSLLWLPDGLWVVDLAGKNGTSVQGKTVRCAKLAEGEPLRVGKFSLRVHYPGAPEAHRRRPKSKSKSISPEVERDPEAGPSASPNGEPSAFSSDKADLILQSEVLDERQQLLEGRELKLSEAQMRLAAEWDRLHADRAAITVIGEDLARRHEALANEERRQFEQAESLERQRREMAARAAEITEIRKNLKAEWAKLETARANVTDTKQRLTAEREELSSIQQELQRRRVEITSSDQTPQQEIDMIFAAPTVAPAGDVDMLEATRHNKVFATERNGDTLVVIPLGDATDFHYGDVHTESNKVRRLLEGGSFKNLVVDLGSAPVFTTVTIKVVVVLSRIVSNRGGQAVLCEASAKTREVLQTMKLLELWPHFDSREEAIRNFAGVGNS